MNHEINSFPENKISSEYGLKQNETEHIAYWTEKNEQNRSESDLHENMSEQFRALVI